MKLMTVEFAVFTFLKKNTCRHMYTAIPTTVLYNIYCPKGDGSVILLGWSSMNARQMRSVSRATIVLPCMAMTDKSESLSVFIVDLSQVWSLRRQENDLSVSVLPTGKTARIFSSSRILGKKIPSAWLAIMQATDSSGIASSNDSTSERAHFQTPQEAEENAPISLPEL